MLSNAFKELERANKDVLDSVVHGTQELLEGQKSARGCPQLFRNKSQIFLSVEKAQSNCFHATLMIFSETSSSLK